MSRYAVMIRRRLALAAIVAALFLHCAVAAEGKDEEIKHLLDYIARSGCTFIRNGNAYPAAEAYEHMAMKYNYAKSRIKTAEQFIEYIASRSSISGRAYQISCEGKTLAGETVPSASWLTAELNRFRSEQKP